MIRSTMQGLLSAVVIGVVCGAWAVIMAARPATVSEAERVELPTLHALGAGLTDDAAIVQAAVDYFYANADRLALAWDVDHPERLKGIYSMILVHSSTPIGEIPAFPTSLSNFLTQERAHCGSYTWVQIQIARGLGMEVRGIEFVGEHAFMEALIDGRGEIFDATVSVWIDQPIEDLLRGVERRYRYFYTPMYDPDFPMYRAHLNEGYDYFALRRRMPLIGITYHPPGEQRFGTYALPT